MDLDDLFDRGHRRGKHGYRDHDDDHGHDGGRYREHDDHLDDRGHHEGSDRWREHREPHHDELFDLSHLAHRLLADKKLLILIGVVLLVVIALAAIFVLPLLGQAVDYVDKSGLKGVVDRVWQGTGGGK